MDRSPGSSAQYGGRRENALCGLSQIKSFGPFKHNAQRGFLKLILDAVVFGDLTDMFHVQSRDHFDRHGQGRAGVHYQVVAQLLNLGPLLVGKNDFDGLVGKRGALGYFNDLGACELRVFSARIGSHWVRDP